MNHHSGSLLLAAVAVAGLTACGSGSTAASAPAPTSAAPTSSAPTSAAPAPSSPSPSSSASRHTTTPAKSSPCPVSAKTLDRVAGLPDHVKMDPATVECWETWADADMIDPPGDGVFLFEYHPGQGWRYYGQGSGFHCSDLGIKDWDPENPPPFCL